MPPFLSLGAGVVVRNGRCSFEEFRDLVREAAEGQPSACGRLCEIAPQIFRHVPKARGASLKAPTVTHALVLMIAHDARRPAAYTYCPYEEDWIDRMTEATRRQLQQPRFSPIAARRLLKARNGPTAKFAGFEKVRCPG